MTTDTDAGAVVLALGGIALEATGWALRAVLVPALALTLTLAGYRPSSRADISQLCTSRPQRQKRAPEAPKGAAEQQLQPTATRPRKRASRAKTKTTKTATTTTAAVAA